MPTELHSLNAKVDSINRKEIEKLCWPRHKFVAHNKVTSMTNTRKSFFDLIHFRTHHLPYIWAPVEKPCYPDSWREANADILAIKNEIAAVIAEAKFELIAPRMEKKKLEIEEDVQKMTTIIVASI